MSEESIVTIIKALMDKELLAWNASYDIRIVRNNLGVNLLPALVADVMLMKHTIQEEGFFSLKQTMVEYQDYLGIDAKEEANKEQIALKENVSKNGGSTTRANYEMYKADLDVMGPYAAADAYYTFALGEMFYDKLVEEGLTEFFFDKEVMPLYKEVTIPMESKGVKINLSLIEEMKVAISKDITILHNKIQDSLFSTPEAKKWFTYMLDKLYPVSYRGNFAQGVCEYYKLDLPVSEKSGKYSVSAANINKLPDSKAKEFLQDSDNSKLPKKDILQIQELLYFKKESNHINLSSKKQMGEIVFDFMKIKPLSKTEKGNPQFNETMIQHLSDSLDIDWARDLSNLNKLYKIEGSYIDRFLANHEDGYFYFYYKQHGTISGRFSSDAQQLPRPKEEGELDEIVLKYNNVIREFFIVEEDRVFIDLDYESLEPHVFAHVSNDEGLRDIFRKGHDFYSTIAIQTEKLKGVSADKSADNYLGKMNKPLRQKAKAYCFTKDVLVDTVEGPCPISKIVVGDFVKTRQGYRPVEKLFNRESNVILVHTNRGTLECTKDHPFLVENTWVDASELKKGDLLNYSSDVNTCDDLDYVRLPIFSNFYFRNGGSKSMGELSLTEDWAYFVGAVLGDGVISISQKNSKHGHGLKGYVGICGLESDGFLRHIESFVESLGYKMRVSEDRGDFKTLITTNSELAKLVYDTLKIGDMDADKKVKNLKVPDYIFKSPREVKLAFLAGLFDTDGYLKNNNGVSDITLCSKDHRLSTGVVRLLHSLGVETSYRLDYNKTYKRNYYLVRVSRSGGRRLAELGMSFYMKCERKKEAVESCIHLVDYYKKSRVRPTQVISVEVVNGVKDVFDIKVSDCHEFYANGVLVHNCLGVPYGMGPYALGMALDIDKEEAGALIDGYLDGFPDLKEWMERSKNDSQYKGYVSTQTGRVRHLDKVMLLHKRHGEKLLNWKYRKKIEKSYGKEEVLSMYRDYKNGINNSRNFQIQGLSASIVNLAMIEINRYLKSKNIDAWVCATVHDQIIVNCPEEYAEETSKVIESIMCNTVKLSVTLKAPPELAKNWKESH